MSYTEPANENKFQNQQVHSKDVFDLHHYKSLKKYLISLGLNPYSETWGSRFRQNVVVYTLVIGIIPMILFNPLHSKEYLLLANSDIKSFYLKSLMNLFIIVFFSLLIGNIVCFTLFRHQFLQLCVVIRDMDFDGVIDQVPHLLITVSSIIKFENIILNKKHFKKFLDFITRDWEVLTLELPALEKTTAQGNKLAWLYRVTLFVAVTCFIYVPLINPTLDLIIPLNETRPREQLFGVCYVFIDVADHFTSIFLHMSWVSLVVVYNVAVVDSLYILIIHHVCGLFDVCGYQIEMAFGNNKLHYYRFKQCVMSHHKALEFFSYLQECTRNMFLLLVAINMILISMTAVQILMHIDRPLDCSRFVLFFLCVQFHLYVISLFGQTILNHSTVLAEKLYSSNWYEIPIKYQKFLCIMIVKCNKPCTLSAGGLYDMNMENYGKAVKACMSYFTMFLSMRE